MRPLILLLWFWVVAAPHVLACDLCAVYRAEEGNIETSSGLVFSVAEQFIPYRTVQFEGDEVQVTNSDYVDSSITHLVAGYNFSSRFGLSLNVPLQHLQFRRTDFRYSLNGPAVLETETGHESGVGDIALIGRVALWEQSSTNSRLVVNLLAGVKFPTGDDDRLDDEIEQTRIFDALVPPGTPHDPLAHSIASVHQHNLALGSGSFDGIFGLTVSGNWRRLFFNAQFQYYLRTEGRSDFKYGDELMISGGPGVFLVRAESGTLTLQANAAYDRMERDELLGRASDRTGFTAWYFGPLLNFTWRSQFSANIGVDIPLSIDNRGFQSVPDYRLHGGVSWRF